MPNAPSYCEFVESPIRQRAGEMVGLPFDTTPWGGNPTLGESRAFDITAGTMEPADVLLGGPTKEGNVVRFPNVGPLVYPHRYHVEVEVTIDGNLFIPFYRIEVDP